MENFYLGRKLEFGSHGSQRGYAVIISECISRFQARLTFPSHNQGDNVYFWGFQRVKSKWW